MERLTQQNSTYYEKAIKQLQEYENTGLTPAKIEQLQKENAELKARLEKSVELPCKVGDILKTQYENSLIGGITEKLFSVYYKENSLAFAIKEINSINDMLLMFICRDKFEKIGNIFDNPELIKE